MLLIMFIIFILLLPSKVKRNVSKRSITPNSDGLVKLDLLL